MGREVLRQACERACQQSLRALPADACSLKYGKRNSVERECQRRGVEVPSRENLAVLAEHQRIVPGAIELGFQRGGEQPHCRVTRAMHVGGAAEAERILKAASVPTFEEQATCQQLAQLVRAPLRTREWPSGLHPRIQRRCTGAEA